MAVAGHYGCAAACHVARGHDAVRREFGLGKYPAVSLQAARDKAATYLSKTSQGIDPNAERKATANAAIAAQAMLRTFGDCEKEAIEAKAPG